MKHLRRLLPVLCAALAMLLLCGAFAFSSAAEKSDKNDTSIPADTLITYGYLQSVLEDLKLELLEELASADGSITVSSPYTDITLEEGAVLTLGSDAEAIFRGGDAVVITVSAESGYGITDLSAGKECFSGELLSFGHIYYKTNPKSRAYILVTGDKAAFTMKGTYETR